MLIKAITKTLYRTAPHRGKIEYRTAEDFRILPDITDSTVGKVYDVCKIFLDMFTNWKYKHIYIMLKPE